MVIPEARDPVGQVLDCRPVPVQYVVARGCDQLAVRLPLHLEFLQSVLLHQPLADRGVARCDRLDCRVVEHRLVEVVSRPRGALVGEDLCDESLLALDGLVEIAVESARRDVAEVLHLAEHVALTLDSPQALLEVARAPRAVDVVDGGEAGLDVGARPKLLGRAEEHPHLTRVHLLEERVPALRSRVVMDEGDLRFGDSQTDELRLNLSVDVPCVPRRGRCVAEDELRSEVRRRVRPDPRDVLRARLEFASLRAVLGLRVPYAVEDPGGERERSALGRYLQEVVLGGVHAALADELGAVGELLDQLPLLIVGLDGHDLDLHLGHVEIEVVLRHDVSEGVDAGHELGQVVELGEPLLDLESVALGFHLDRLHGLAVGLRPV